MSPKKEFSRPRPLDCWKSWETPSQLPKSIASIMEKKYKPTQLANDFRINHRVYILKSFAIVLHLGRPLQEYAR